MRYFLGFLITILLLFMLILLLFRGGSKPKVQVTGKALSSYATTDAEVRLTTDGPVNAEEEHQQSGLPPIAIMLPMNILEATMATSLKVSDLTTPKTVTPPFCFLCLMPALPKLKLSPILPSGTNAATVLSATATFLS